MLIEDNLIYELMDSQTSTGKPIQVNKWTASIQGENRIEVAHAIARAINTRDSSDDLINDLLGIIKELDDAVGPKCGFCRYVESGHRHEESCKIVQIRRKANALLREAKEGL